MTALLTVATLLIRIPIPATQGYINLGDDAVIAVALVWGPRSAMIGGGLGSAMADLLGGYVFWAPFTLIIKGLEGLLVGLVNTRIRLRLGRRWGFAASVGGLTIIAGYYFVEAGLYGADVVNVSAISNTIQAIGGVVAGVATATILRRATDRLHPQHDRI